MFEKINGHRAARQAGFPRARPVRGGTDIDAERFREGGPFTLNLDTAVGRANDAHIVSEGREFFGQGTHHIGQSADFDERINFWSDEQNFQGRHSKQTAASGRDCRG